MVNEIRAWNKDRVRMGGMDEPDGPTAARPHNPSDAQAEDAAPEEGLLGNLTLAQPTGIRATGKRH